jgi:PEGA domain-containing protein
MYKAFRFSSLALLAQLCVLLAAFSLIAQDSEVMGEIKLEGATKVEKGAGVWVDGQYVGYMKELKGRKKVLLLPGRHQITARTSGYGDFASGILVEPGQVQTLRVKMSLLPGAETPKITSELKLTIQPSRAAVFIDGNYVGHAGEMGGAVHSLLVSPGKHRIKVELPGYRSFETEVTLHAGQKSEVKTELVKGSIDHASADIRKPQ